jgi:tetratricopeptide (TPR) repeat protein
MSRSGAFSFLILIAIVCLWVFAPSLSYGYLLLYDDGPLILENNAVLAEGFDRVKIAFSEFVYGLYHPITSLSFAMNYDLTDGRPGGMHFVNLTYHVLNGLLVYVLINHFAKDRRWSLLGASLFVLHPMHVESVVWLSERKDLLYTFFFLLSLIIYLHWRLKQSWAWYGLSILVFVLSLLSKSAAVVFPLVLVGYLFFWEKKRELKAYLHSIPYFVLSLVFGVINIRAQETAGFIRDLSADYNILDRIFMFFYSLSYYLSKFFIPLESVPKHFYPIKEGVGLPIEYYLSLIPIAAFIYLIVRWWKQYPQRVFGLMTFFFIILPVLKIIPTGNDMVSDRYSYLPYFGLILSACLLLKELKSQKLSLALVVVFCLISAYFSRSYVSVWENEETLWTSVIQANPKHSVGYTERGRAYVVMAKYEQALNDLSTSLKIDSTNALAWNNRGSCYAGLGNIRQAVFDFSKAIELDPEYAFAYSNRGIEYFKVGERELAFADFDQAIELEPENAGHYNNKGIALAQSGSLPDAIDYFKKALELNPGLQDAQLNLERAISLMGSSE